MNSAMQPSTPLDVKLMNWTATALFVGLLLGLLLSVGGWVLRLPMFAVAQVYVEGDLQHTNAVQVRTQVAPHVTGNFFTLDLPAAQQAFEQVAWVRRAQIKREFPSSLRVLLREHEPAARWGEPGANTLVNQQGEVFEADSDELGDDLPRFAGQPERAAQMLDLYRALVPLLAPLGSAIDSVHLSSYGSWRVVLDSGATLVLGTGTQEQLLQGVQRLVRTLGRVTQSYGRSLKDVEYADLCHSGGYALRLRGVTTLSTENAAGTAPARPTVRPPAANQHRG